MLTPHSMKVLSTCSLITDLQVKQALYGLTPIESELLSRLEALLDYVFELEERIYVSETANGE